MERAPNVGKVFFPLDEELGLLPGNLAPRQQEHLAHLACFMPFDKAAEMVGAILSVQTNEETARQLTEHMGACMETAQTVEVDAPDSQEAKDGPVPQRCVISSDGAMVSLVHKQWAEVRTLAIGEPEERRNADGEIEIHVGKLSYFSRLADASTFIDLAEVEIRRRKVREAKSVSAVMDGAEWCQSLTDRYRPDAVRILDFPHAGEHISLLLEGLERARMHFPPQMLSRCLHILKHRGPRPLLRMADRHLGHCAQHEGESSHLGYLRKREALMQYPQFRKRGWPIGSGMVESANKNVVEARLKGTGMHWERKNVNPMLALRNAVCNGRWQEMWQKAVLQHQQQQVLHRKDRVEQRAQSLRACGKSSQVPSSPESSAASDRTSPHSLSQALSEGESASVSHPSPVPTAVRPASSHPSVPRSRMRGTHRDTSQREQHSSHQTKSELTGQSCLCGTPVMQSKGGGRTRHYCSDRCRVSAYRKREKKWVSSVTRHSD
jgi:hypothetical protein